MQAILENKGSVVKDVILMDSNIMEIQQTIIYVSFISSNLGFKTMVQFKCFVGIITGITMHLSYLNLLSYESSLYFSWMYSSVIETWEGTRVTSEELLHTPPCDLLTVVPVEWRPLDIFCHHSECGEQAFGT